MLLGICEQLIGLRPNLTPFVIGQLLTHLLYEDQQRPPRTFSIATPFRDPSGSLDNGFCLMSVSKTAKDYSLTGECFCQKSIFTTPFECIQGSFDGTLRRMMIPRCKAKLRQSLIHLCAANCVTEFVEYGTRAFKMNLGFLKPL